ncbi:MAG: hypothetical protein ACLRNQ_19130 [Flavonifractor plautii]
MSIVKMKRSRLIGMQAERESLLRSLQHMGCVEIDEPPHLGDDPEWAALTRPDPGALNAARDARSRVEGALRTLKIRPQAEGRVAQAPAGGHRGGAL